MGHPLLRTVAREVSRDEIPTAAIQELVRDMIETMDAVNGAGLAAPQVGHSLRICALQVEKNERYPDLPSLPLRVWINPCLTVLSPSPRVQMYEGCLSVRGVRGRVERPAHLRVESLDRQGEPQVDEFSGFLAAVAQHECDHLDGVLFVDRADSTTLCFIDEYLAFVPADERLVLLD